MDAMDREALRADECVKERTAMANVDETTGRRSVELEFDLPGTPEQVWQAWIAQQFPQRKAEVG
jgi:hypothetical protein